jgi:hypothetical protein
MTTPTDRTRQLVEKLPDEDTKHRVLALFEREPALFGPATVDVVERVHVAVIRLAFDGSAGMAVAERLYREDTRDLLVSAGFAHDLQAHHAWARSVLCA